MRTGRLLHLVYMGRSRTVTRKEGSSQFAFTAEAKCEQHEGDRAQELCQRFQKNPERFRAPCGRRTQHCTEEQKHPSNMRKSCFKQPETKTPPGFWMANSDRALLTTNPNEQRVGFVLCLPSEFINLCTIFALVSFNSPALLPILPCWPGTWARCLRSSGCRGGTRCQPPPRRATKGRAWLSLSSQCLTSPACWIELRQQK